MLTQGVSHVAKPPLGRCARKAHFAHPLEFEFELLVEDPPPPALWPTLFFQVSVCASDHQMSRHLELLGHSMHIVY